MCGRTVLFGAREQIMAAARAQEWMSNTSDDDNTDNGNRQKNTAKYGYNISPQTYQPVVTVVDGKRVVQNMKWGLVPSWSKDGNPLTINSRDDSIASKPLYKSLKNKYRCLVACQGYYEWKRQGDNRQPYYYHHNNGDIMFLAGFYSKYKSAADAEVLYTYSIITTNSKGRNGLELVADVHDRMPVVLFDAADIDKWLDVNKKWDEVASVIDKNSNGMICMEDVHTGSGGGGAGGYIKWKDEKFVLYRRKVSKYVSNSRNEGVECIQSVSSAPTSTHVPTFTSETPRQAVRTPQKSQQKITDYYNFGKAVDESGIFSTTPPPPSSSPSTTTTTTSTTTSTAANITSSSRKSTSRRKSGSIPPLIYSSPAPNNDQTVVHGETKLKQSIWPDRKRKSPPSHSGSPVKSAKKRRVS